MACLTWSKASRGRPGKFIVVSIKETVVVLAMGERHVRLDCFDIHCRHEGDFTEVTFTLAALVLQNMALALFTAQHLTRGSYFEPLGVSFPRLGDTGIFGHRGGDGKGEASFGKGFFTISCSLSKFSAYERSQIWESEISRISKIKVVLIIQDC